MDRIQRERRTLAVMIGLYCRRCHRNRGDDGICPDCSELLEYGLRRIDACPFRERKPACSDCPVHCYRPDMRERIREVMRRTGPVMIFRHPFLAAAHMLDRLHPRQGHGKNRTVRSPDPPPTPLRSSSQRECTRVDPHPDK